MSQYGTLEFKDNSAPYASFQRLLMRNSFPDWNLIAAPTRYVAPASSLPAAQKSLSGRHGAESPDVQRGSAIQKKHYFVLGKH
jgi:hypothetical protein